MSNSYKRSSHVIQNKPLEIIVGNVCGQFENLFNYTVNSAIYTSNLLTKSSFKLDAKRLTKVCSYGWLEEVSVIDVMESLLRNERLRSNVKSKISTLSDSLYYDEFSSEDVAKFAIWNMINQVVAHIAPNKTGLSKYRVGQTNDYVFFLSDRDYSVSKYNDLKEGFDATFTK